jgi:hypothetical protein
MTRPVRPCFALSSLETCANFFAVAHADGVVRQPLVRVPMGMVGSPFDEHLALLVDGDVPRTVNRLLLHVMDGGEAVVAFSPNTPLVTAVDGYDPLVLSAHFIHSKNCKGQALEVPLNLVRISCTLGEKPSKYAMKSSRKRCPAALALCLASVNSETV